MNWSLADEGSISKPCVVRLSLKSDEEDEEGDSAVHRKSLRKTLRERERKNIARVKPVQYLFIF